MARSICIFICLGVGFFSATDTWGFTLFGFPTEEAVSNNLYSRWALDNGEIPPLSLSYSFDAVSFAGIAGAGDAIDSAFHGWDAINSVLDFTGSGYGPVLNTNENLPQSGEEWEGPIGSGLGANVDVFLVPKTYQADFINTSFVFDSPNQNLASTFVQRWGQNDEFNTIDIYLNSNFNWTTDGSGYDIQTVVLHEIGHGLGLDHPDMAAANGAANYDPLTFAPGSSYSSDDVMYSQYAGVKQDLTFDEIGGLNFLYGGGLIGDTNGDGVVDVNDLSVLASNWYALVSGGYDSGDFDIDGVVNLQDLSALASNWQVGTEPAPMPVPEPGLFTLFVLGSIGLLRKRRTG